MKQINKKQALKKLARQQLISRISIGVACFLISLKGFIYAWQINSLCCYNPTIVDIFSIGIYVLPLAIYLAWFIILPFRGELI